MVEGGWQKAEGGRWNTDNRRKKADGGRRKTEDGMQKAEGGNKGNQYFQK